MSYQELKAGKEYWFVRQYETDFETLKKDPSSNGLNYDENGNVTNKLVWEDPKIADGTNFNIITDYGKAMLWNTMFGLAGSGTFSWMAYGASSTLAAHDDKHLGYEHILDGTRIILTNSLGTLMTSGSVTAFSTFVDTSFTPNITYYTSATVMGTILGSATNNVNQPVQEFGLASAGPCPATPDGNSGVLFNRFVLGAATTIFNTTTFQIVLVLRS